MVTHHQIWLVIFYQWYQDIAHDSTSPLTIATAAHYCLKSAIVQDSTFLALWMIVLRQKPSQPWPAHFVRNPQITLEKNIAQFQHYAIIESVINNMFWFTVYMNQIGIGLLELLFHCPSWTLNSGCQMLCRIQHFRGGSPLQA